MLSTMKTTLVHADITAQEVDAIVNAANSSLQGGGGVDGAIHRKGGPQILAECQKLRDSRHGRGLPPGQAVATTAGRLPARWVIHTVGPVYSRSLDHSELLRSCYRRALAVADELGASSIAFPLISAGTYGWPAADAIGQAWEILTTQPTEVAQAQLVLFTQETYELAQQVTGTRPALRPPSVRLIAFPVPGSTC